MGLLVQLANLAGIRCPATAAALPRSCRSGRLTVSAATPGGRVKEEAEEKGAGKKEKVVIRVSDPVRARRLPPPLFSGPETPSEPPPAPAAERRRNEQGDAEAKLQYYVNMGHAIRTLREELPVLFYREPSFDIYSDNIVFKDPLNNFSGIDNYRRIFWALQFVGQILFKAVWIDIVSIWQPVDNVIMIWWTVHGSPRVLWEGYGSFEGTSEYKLGKNGKIYEHKVDNLARNSPSKFRVLQVEELIRSLGCPSTPKPTYFETSYLYATSNILTPIALLVEIDMDAILLALAFYWNKFCQ